MGRYFPPVCVHKITFRDLKDRRAKRGRKEKREREREKTEKKNEVRRERKIIWKMELASRIATRIIRDFAYVLIYTV